MNTVPETTVESVERIFDYRRVSPLWSRRLAYAVGAFLLTHGGVAIAEMQRVVGATRGNLDALLRDLLDANFATTELKIVGDKARRYIALTIAGRIDFIECRQRLFAMTQYRPKML